YRVNGIAPLALLQAALPALRAAHGTVVDITSDAAVEGYEGWGGYRSADAPEGYYVLCCEVSTNASFEQLTHVRAAEEPDVRVYWFDPGDMRTQMHQEAFPGEDISDRPEPETVVHPIHA